MTPGQPPRPVTFVLAPLDQGVRNLAGRDGSALGPARLLAALRERGRLPPDARAREVQVQNTAASLEDDLEAISEAVCAVLGSGRFPVVLGGDHGTTYANVRGLCRHVGGSGPTGVPATGPSGARGPPGASGRGASGPSGPSARARPVGVVYLDVHFDMRPHTPHHTSGSSFSRLLEEGYVAGERMHPLGLVRPVDPEALERSRFDELAAWADEKGVPWCTLADVRAQGVDAAVATTMGADDDTAWHVSFDVDALDERWAPGVSAPGTGRFSLDEAVAGVRAAARGCASFDVAEYAPRLDEGDRTLESVLAVLEALLEERTLTSSTGSDP